MNAGGVVANDGSGDEGTDMMMVIVVMMMRIVNYVGNGSNSSDEGDGSE